VPRHDTSLRLPAEPPRDALARDEALLDQVEPGGPWLERLWLPSSSAVVLGLGMRHRRDEVVDVVRCAQAGLDVLERRAGGGAVLVDAHMVCGAICAPLPAARIADDVTESYRWLGEHLLSGLHALGVADARRVEVAEARADSQSQKAGSDPSARLLPSACYGGLSPHEIVVGGAKLVGLAQIRRRHAVLFQYGILLRDQSPLADVLEVPDEASRAQLRAALQRRTVGLAQLLDLERAALIQKIARLSAFAAASAASDARPYAP
jgi:lipoate-protein ligase A